ncbi:hypothetical protein [Permianibacter aggregans]|uniref:PIN domain-containing protein n=1 Tax=Permianibacter aggregans TaxID=1510150 RepID=A0A4R6UF54_9GAMM|nr:hypothetical protein [Permianibacter aggregans]QGX40594.1 hypothetical protein E2H98_13320 [Permianibacter aggregans]TDQ43843.1 hypothetical protein EV696_1271 [Permianibacter aggregans]
MCVVIDTCSISVVFDRGNLLHKNFAPVLEWIVNGGGKLVMGGSKYLKEIENMSRYLALFKTLDDARKIVRVDRGAVDKKQRELEKLLRHSAFDDPHIVALLSRNGSSPGSAGVAAAV